MLFDSRRAFFFQHGMSEIVKSGMAIFSPIIFIFGCYLILAGHLSPGGAFQGGVVLAAISVVITVAYGLWYQALPDSGHPGSTEVEGLKELPVLLILIPLVTAFAIPLISVVIRRRYLVLALLGTALTALLSIWGLFLALDTTIVYPVGGWSLPWELFSHWNPPLRYGLSALSAV
ncbi:MAG: hypothetical protein FH749_14220 [Firmicutes bacterium]|nr:hypothetical protein [Bacillota bacterium]